VNHTGLTDCQSCHSPPGGHFPGQCSNCHNTEDWDDGEFSHDGLTNCNSCHSPPDDDDEHEPPVPHCSECHNTEDWDDADDDLNAFIDWFNQQQEILAIKPIYQIGTI
jgi:hypothetical protein